jgi:hypothetical protein
MSSQENDAEILALRHQLLLVLQRQLGPDRVRFTPSDRALLALLHGLPRNVLKRLRRVVRPDTVLRWHRDMLPRRHARRSRPARSGWQRTVRSIRVLVLRLVRENPGPGSTRRLSAVPSRGLVSCVPRCGPAGLRLLRDGHPVRGTAACACGDRACQPQDKDPRRHRLVDGTLGSPGGQDVVMDLEDAGCRGTLPDQGQGREVPGHVRRHPR